MYTNIKFNKRQETIAQEQAQREIAQREYQKRQASKAKINQPKFRGAALELQVNTSFECIIEGPAETGKTFASLWFVDQFLRKYDNAVGAIVRDTAKALYSTVLRTYAKIRKHYGDIKVYGGEKPEWFDYPNGSRLYVFGLDQSEKLLSAEFDIVYSNQTERIPLADWETLTTRTTGRAGNAPYTFVIGDCNPSGANHWILNRPNVKLLHSRHIDNPLLFDDNGDITDQGIKSLGILSNLSGVRLDRLYKGLWVNAEGIIYGDYDANVHLINRFDIPSDWYRFRVIDFGYTNPFVCKWYALDNDDRIYMYREIYKTQTLVEDLAIEIINLSEGENISATICDHDAEDRATLLRRGIETIPAFKAVKLGIQAVQSRFKLAGNKKPRFFYLKDSLVEVDTELEAAHKPTCTIEEIEGYVWAKSANGELNKEEPVKKDDHGLDCDRYAVAFVDNIAYELEPQEETIVEYTPFTISPY